MLRARQCRVQKVNHQQYAVLVYAQASGTEQCLIARIWLSSILVSLSHFVLLHCWVCSMDDLCTFAPLHLQQGWPLYFCTAELATRTTFVLCTVEFATRTSVVLLHRWVCNKDDLCTLHSWVYNMDDLCSFAQLILQLSNIPAGLHSWVWFSLPYSWVWFLIFLSHLDCHRMLLGFGYVY